MTRFLLVVAVASGCGGDDAPAPDAFVVQPTRVVIRGNGISGATNKIVLANVTMTTGGPSLGAICVQITADPQSFVAVAATPSMGNPCMLGAEVMFADGTYNVTAGIYTPGMQTPDLCASATVTVAGIGDVTLPAFHTCP